MEAEVEAGSSVTVSSLRRALESRDWGWRVPPWAGHSGSRGRGAGSGAGPASQGTAAEQRAVSSEQ